MIVWTDDERAFEPSHAGSKASALARLAARGFPVPRGFVVTTEAFDAFLTCNALGDSASEREVEACKLPTPVVDAITNALGALGDGPVAVRSSAEAEDLGDASFAGQYETVLDVRGADAVCQAVVRCFASLYAERVRAYRGAKPAGRMAVLVQRMVAARAAGVAFTADPATGERNVVCVSAVPGVGESLVSGEVSAEEWRVAGAEAIRVRTAREALSASDARRVAELARDVHASLAAPQDVEWALDGDSVVLLQARPLTGLPEAVSWETTETGGWVRNFRLGEWIGAPVSPLFETWLLLRLENELHAYFEELTGFPSPKPLHIIVNGWYFYGLRMAPLGWRAPVVFVVFLFRLLTRFRQVAAVVPPLARFGFDAESKRWREELLPEYQRAVAFAETALDTSRPEAIPQLVDDLVHAASLQFGSIVGVAGYAAKTELPLAAFWKQNLSELDACWLDVVRTDPVAPPLPHAVQGLDWVFPTLGETGVDVAPPDATRVAEARRRADATLSRAYEALAHAPKKRATLDALVAEARRAHPVREEQTRALTLAWPTLRRAALLLGEHLAARGTVAAAQDVFFLTRSEVDAALGGDDHDLRGVVAQRRDTWNRHHRLSPPLMVGKLDGFFAKVFGEVDEILDTGVVADDVTILGMPGSAGRARGRVRVLRSMAELPRLAQGEVLVAPVTTPGWTPAFSRAIAVITDTGSVASHASAVAREYGIPAVVAAAGATGRLRDGQFVEVDGGRGIVRILAQATADTLPGSPATPARHDPAIVVA